MSSLKPCMSKMEKFIGPLESEGVPKPSKGDAATGLKVAKPDEETVPCYVKHVAANSKYANRL